MAKKLDHSNPQHRLYARLVLARRDIEEARRIVQYVLDRIERPNDRLFRPLSCASVIAYTRALKSSKGYPPLPKRYQSFDEPELSALHREIIHLRDTCVAHTDKEFTEVVLVPVPSKGSAPTDGSSIRSRTLLFSAFPLFRDLCEQQLERLRGHISEQRGRLST